MPKDIGCYELSGEQLALRCYELNAAAAELESILRPELSQLGQKIPIYAFSCRLKGQERIQNKVLRVRDLLDVKLTDGKRPPYNPEDVTDVWGCRFVTLFQSHILAVMSEIFRQIVTWEKEGRSFAIEKINVYTNRPDNDPASWAPKARRLIQNNMVAPELDKIEYIVDSQDTGYSAVHFILNAKFPRKPRGEVTIETVRFEMQVRDIFEEAWSQVSHIVSYGERDRLYRSGARSHGTVEMILGRPQLNALKTVADGCSQIAEQIRLTYGDLRGRLSIVDDRSTYVSLSSLDETRKLILECIPAGRADLIKTVTTAFDLVKDARDAGDREFDRRVARSNYRAAAQKFKEAFDSLHSDAQLQDILQIVLPDNWTIESNLKIEEANALMFGLPSRLQDEADENAYKRACSLYRGLEAKDPDDPMVQLRLAQAERKVVSSEEHGIAVINRLRNCLLLLDKATYLRPEERDITNQLACIELGLARHDYSEHASSRDERTRALCQAVADVQALVPDQLPPSQEPEQLRLYHRAMSNVLWFYHRLKSSGETVLSEADTRVVSSNIEKLCSDEIWAIVRFYPETIENLMYGYDLLGDRRNAEAMADHNLELLQEIAGDQRHPDSNRDITEVLGPEEKDIYLRALIFKSETAQRRRRRDAPDNSDSRSS
jgi:ppGpp synthetase/RelA/SpoT-type nucleotidyltranferase